MGQRPVRRPGFWVTYGACFVQYGFIAPAANTNDYDSATDAEKRAADEAALDAELEKAAPNPIEALRIWRRLERGAQ